MFSIKETLPVIFPEFAVVETAKEMHELVAMAAEPLRTRWNESGQTDFSIYTDPLYLYEAFISFYKISVITPGQLKKWVRENNIDPTKHTWFDLYNGIGLTSLYLTDMGFKLSVHNDNPDQIEAMLKLYSHYKMKPPKILDTWRDQRFDFVSAFEVVEHFDEPKLIVTDLLNCVKGKGWYVESTGFADPTYPGHFNHYKVDGQMIDNRQAARAIAKHTVESGFKKIFIGYNKKPRIWQRQ